MYKNIRLAAQNGTAQWSKVGDKESSFTMQTGSVTWNFHLLSFRHWFRSPINWWGLLIVRLALSVTLGSSGTLERYRVWVFGFKMKCFSIAVLVEGVNPKFFIFQIGLLHVIKWMVFSNFVKLFRKLIALYTCVSILRNALIYWI